MRPPPAIIVGNVQRRAVDGVSDDLLTGGLGLAGLRGPAPDFAESAAPTATELRRRAIYQAYRGLLDVSDEGGFGRLFGPIGDVRVAGVEYLLAVRQPHGRGVSTVCVQIPAHFAPGRPLLLAVASSGSRGIYGALPTAAPWGLLRGAAVVHTDKAAGNGVWDVDAGRGVLIDGRVSFDAADPLQLYVPPATPGLAALGTRAPHTLLFKHAHSGENVEAAWGLHLLQAIEVALELLGREHAGRVFTPANVRILAAGVSNGGAAVLRALEADGGAVIHGAVASEPNAVVGTRTAGLTLKSGASHLEAAGFGLYDYSNLHYLLQPAAVLAETDPGAPFAASTEARRGELEQWCRRLQSMQALPPGSIEDGARGARKLLLDAGMLESGLALGHFNIAAGMWSSVMVTYAAAYARLAPWEQPYGLSFAFVDAQGVPRAPTPTEFALLWSDANGIPPTAGTTLIADTPSGRRACPFGSLELALAAAPDRLLALTGFKGELPPGREALLARIQHGHAQTVMNGVLGARPVVIVHGRADGLIPVNHSSRAYYAVSQNAGQSPELRYYELVHGQHFDGCLGLPGFAERYVPLQPWIGHALELVYQRLERGTALPPSQVLRSQPRAAAAGGLLPLTAANLGTLTRAPAEREAIHYRAPTLYVPE